MQRNIRLLLVLLGSAFMLSCPAEHPASLIVTQMGAMSRQNQCTIMANANIQYIRPFGILDLAVTNHYYAFPIVYNNMSSEESISGEGAENLNVERNYITIRGADIRLDIPLEIYQDNLSDQNLLYKVMTSGFFAPSTATVKAEKEGLVALEVIPPEVGNVLRKVFKAKVDKDPCFHPSATVYVFFKIKGVGIDGHEIDSREFMFPVKLCWGCLIRYVVRHPEVAQITNVQAPCLPGQDEAMDNILCLMVSLDKRICYDVCAKKNL